MTKYLKFWGTRGSCSVSGHEYTHFGGNTCCLEVRYQDTLVIIDAGTGIRPLGETVHEKKIDLFLSHTHWDHIIGFPFFEPLYRKGTHITIWAPQGHENRSCRDLFDQVLAYEFFPINLDEMQATLEFKVIEERKPIQLGPLSLDFHTTRHPGLTYCFKIKTPHETIGYTTDNEIDLEAQKSFIEFHQNCDYFIHEAQYTPDEYQHRKGWGHSSLANVLKLVELVKPKHWLVTHHDPKHTDADLKILAEKARHHNLPCPSQWVADGRIIALK